MVYPCYTHIHRVSHPATGDPLVDNPRQHRHRLARNCFWSRPILLGHMLRVKVAVAAFGWGWHSLRNSERPLDLPQLSSFRPGDMVNSTIWIYLKGRQEFWRCIFGSIWFIGKWHVALASAHSWHVHATLKLLRFLGLCWIYAQIMLSHAWILKDILISGLTCLTVFTSNIVMWSDGIWKVGIPKFKPIRNPFSSGLFLSNCKLYGDDLQLWILVALTYLGWVLINRTWIKHVKSIESRSIGHRNRK